MDTKTEWELIARCRSGSAAAFEPLVRTHEARALAMAEMLLGDADDAADAVQDAFVKAFRALGRLRPGSDFGAWFRSILRNHCMDRLRSAPRRSKVRLDARTTADAGGLEPEAPAALEREQLARLVRDALARVSPEHREVLVLKEVEGMSYEEIATVLGIPQGTVASRLYHARATLRKAALAAGLAPEGAGS